MTLEENIKAILECNFSIAREEVIESATKRIIEQISRQYPLEDIKEEIEDNDEYMYDNYGLSVYAIRTDDVLAILDKHIGDKQWK